MAGRATARRALPTLCLLALLAAAGAALPPEPRRPAPAGGGEEPGAGAVNVLEDAAPVSGVPPEELFLRANAAYEAGEYARAAELYEAVRSAGAATGLLHYNLGNAYLRGGELGRAIASYLRSRGQRPRDQDVAANLAFARRSGRDALAPPEPSPVLTTLFFWHYHLSRGELLRAAVALNLLLWGGLAASLWYRRRAWLWVALVFLPPLLAVAGSLAVREVAPRRVAVVVPQEIDARSGPGADAVLRFKLHAGTEVRVVERRESWLRIVLPDGQQGWIRADHAEAVEL